MKTVLALFVLVAAFTSCTTQKTLLRNQQVYSYSLGNDPRSPQPAYTKYEVIRPKKVTVVDNGTYLIIQDNPAADNYHYRPMGGTVAITSPNIPSWKDENIGNAYFSESTDLGARSSFWYADGKFVLQTASIPLKIRSAIKDPVYKDSFPSQVETGVNIGFLIGGKKTWNRYRTSANLFGQRTDKYSLTGGLLLSTGGVDLSATTTRPKIEFGRKALVISYGGAIVLGLNSINLGYAFGWDKPIGSKGSTWLYNGRLWNGIIVSLDLIK